jgi:hypothetical protein
VAPDGLPAITVHQCLFGYEDGHRLLASSAGLSDDTASLLLLLSDLAPGLSTRHVEGYWTGVPLSDAKYYAFMRTWPAPEIPRPGCVWTHVLLIAFPDIARFPNLGILAQHTTRPRTGRVVDAYAKPLSLGDPSSSGDRGEIRRIAPADALRVVRTLYGPRSDGMLFGRPGALDATIFAAWSQQWPRLRRAFAFRTATSAYENPIPGVRFDLRIALDPIHESSQTVDGLAAKPEPWESAAVDDLVSDRPTDFRRFLWRYGSDIRRGRDRFRFLAEIYRSTRTSRLDGKLLETTLTDVAQELSSPEDGRVLKEDLVSFERRQYSLLPVSDPLDTLNYFIRHPDAVALPTPREESLHAIHDLWATRSDEILSIADQAMESDSILGEAVLDRLALVADPMTFLVSTDHRPGLRARLVASNPALLDTDYLVRVPKPELSRLLDLIPEDEAVARPIVGRLLILDDREVAAVLSERFPAITARAVAMGIERSTKRLGPGVPDAWLDAVAGKAGVFLGSGIIEEARSTKSLAAFAAVLRHDSREVLRVGPLPWAKALRTAEDDVDGPQRQVFLAFIMALAIAGATRGCEPLFEKAFEPLHNDLGRSRLPYDASAILLRYLPNLHLWQQWDSCLRLRMAVVAAYVETDLSPESFLRLTANPDLFHRLLRLADDTKLGRRFIKKMGASVRSGSEPLGS